MGLSYFNSNEVESIAVDLKNYADEYTLEINNLFKRLAEVTTVTKEWTGNKAKFYFDRIASDAPVYLSFGDKLKGIGNLLYEDVSNVQNCVKENNLDEEKEI